MHRHRFSHPVDSESSRWDRRDRSKLPSARETLAPQITSLGTPAEVKPRKAQLSVVKSPGVDRLQAQAILAFVGSLRVRRTEGRAGSNDAAVWA